MSGTKYDVVINNGRVMDPETNFDSVANMGIKDGRIMAITKDSLEGMETIDATGHVVAPGFIDTHAHWCLPIGYKLAVLDGRTSLMDLEMGCEGTFVDSWYKDREGSSPVNFGTGSSHELARSTVLGGFKFKVGDIGEALASRGFNDNWSSTKCNLEEGNKILSIVDKGLQDGAIAACSTIGYMRFGVSARESWELCKVAASYMRPIAYHVRGTPGTEVEEVGGYQELLGNAMALGAPAIACHFNNPTWRLVAEMLSTMQKQGFNVWGELYPYSAGMTTLNAVFLDKEIWVDKLGNRYEDTLQDPVTGKFMTNEDRNEMLKTNPTYPIVLYKMPETACVEWLKLPGVAIATDSVPLFQEVGGSIDLDTPMEELPNNHPRGSGSYAKSLRLSREHNIPLMQVVSMTSYNTAKRLGMCGLKVMQERGRMQVGCVADITIFNPDTIQDNATYAQGNLPSSGIPYVIVNGTVVVKDSEFQRNVYPGQPIRYEPNQDGKFEPLSLQHWCDEYQVAGVDMGGCSCCGPTFDNKFLPKPE